MDDALEFLLREVLTGRKLPAAASGVAEVWRKDFEANSAKRLADAQSKMHDQKAFASLVHDILRDFNMGDDRANSSSDEDKQGEEDEEGEAKTEADDESE